jgi:hypothetical protein
MTIPTLELAKARGLTAELLEELQLGDYLFELDAFEDDWQLRLDCASAGGWTSLRLPIDRERLLASADAGSEARRTLLDEWRQRLQACRIGGESH